MVTQMLLSSGTIILRFIFGLIEVFELPYDFVSVLYSILCYGTWVVGSDVLLLCSGCFTFWIGVRLSTGLAVWIYDHLPFIH